jgi:uncharacterized membrane protein YkvA (DUF1232 family)
MASTLYRATTLAGGALTQAARGAAIARHLKLVHPRRLQQFIGRVRLTALLLRDVARGAYPHVPWKTVGALGAALAYFVMPLDAVPDLLPLSGFLDDAVVLGLLFGAAESDLRAYCDWRGVDPRPYFEAKVRR